MNIHEKNLQIDYINNETLLVNLKWLRGAGRYNNGCTIHGNNYRLRLLFSRLKQRKTQG